MNPIRMIVTDLDNTLLDPEKRVTPYTSGVLAACRESGLCLVYATARPARAVTALPSLPLCDFIIADNGASIAREGRLLYVNPIPPDTVKDLLHSAVANPLITCLTAEAGDCLYTDYQGESWGEGWNPVTWDFANPIEAEIIKLSIECADRAVIHHLLKSRPDLHAFSNKNENWYQVMRKDSTKANAVRIVAEWTGTALEQVAAFGDDENDIDMLKTCGVGVAMGNAIDEAKAAADCICGSNDEDGVARWIEEQILPK